MVSFSCENCGDVLTKKKLDPHRNQCRGASFTCLDCMVHFQGFDYRSHTSCISEAQKYQGHLYREKDNKKDKRRPVESTPDSKAMVPKKAYVEDENEENRDTAVAVVDVPPRAPTPPPAASLTATPNVNIFDFMVEDATPNRVTKELEAAHHRLMSRKNRNRDSQSNIEYNQNGFSYGHEPLMPAFERFDSYSQFAESQDSTFDHPPNSFITPGPHARHTGKDKSRTEKSDKKRKRQQVEELDLSATKRPMSRDSMIVDPPSMNRTLHSGLTGGLAKLITDPDFYADRIDAGPTPISPTKRTRREPRPDRDDRRKSSIQTQHMTAKIITSHDLTNEKSSRRHRRDSSSPSVDDRSSRRRTVHKYIEYPDRAGSVQPNATNQLISVNSRAELFVSFINKGPDSERGCSMNKALKRYHREKGLHGEQREDDDKELWKSLRVRMNERGEIVLFV